MAGDSVPVRATQIPRSGITLPLCGVALSLSLLSAQTPAPTVFLSFAQASPVFRALDERAPGAAEWDRWITSADRATRARVARGDEASVVHLLLFGTSFTTQPRITAGQINRDQIRAAVDKRLGDFERAVARPGTNERLQYARSVLGGAPVRARLLSIMDAMFEEGEMLARLTNEAQQLGDPSLEFAERSRLYRYRGLSSDTSVRVNLAIEEALRRAYPAPDGHVRRVAVIGPGLDVVDKQDGHDFYPLQTIQPLAIIDSLVRLGLADADTLHVSTFDVSARVNQHITEMRRRAHANVPYVVHASLEGGIPWTPRLIDYFGTFGASIGSAVPVTVPPGIGPVRLRAVAVRPAVVDRIVARDLNITAQMLSLDEGERFDLVVGTNIFVYYDRLQQGLAMASVEAMLRPGGLLLSNNALVEVPTSGMRAMGYSKTMYSSREEDGDVMVWYQKTSNTAGRQPAVDR